jgi:hypothetical protein
MGEVRFHGSGPVWTRIYDILSQSGLLAPPAPPVPVDLSRPANHRVPPSFRGRGSRPSTGTPLRGFRLRTDGTYIQNRPFSLGAFLRPHHHTDVVFSLLINHPRQTETVRCYVQKLHKCRARKTTHRPGAGRQMGAGVSRDPVPYKVRRYLRTMIPSHRSKHSENWREESSERLQRLITSYHRTKKT